MYLYGNVKVSTIDIGGVKSTATNNYDYSMPEPKLERVSFNGITESYTYDKLERVNETRLGSILSKNFNYLQKGDHFSTLIACEWFGNNKVLKDNLKYSYDKFGNISIIKENGIEIVGYSYDDLSRLIREDNKKLNKTSTYFYDKGGNITERYEYPYTTVETNKLENGIKFTYSYPISGWKDQLVSYNDELFVYDELGNPTTYRNKTLTWQYGRQLASFDTTSYKYNADGIRIAKTYNGVTTHFYLDGTKILAQDNGNLLTFKYGVDGIIGFTYEGVGDFFYKKNILGDILGIFDKNGQEIVKYVYDAWGNHKMYVLNDGAYVDISNHISYTQDGLNNKLIAEINPFRYRGYYFDAETNLYYLNSRYYDSEIGRFINADALEVLSKTLDEFNGLNLYAYCFNNPTNTFDDDGQLAWWKKLLIGLAIIVGVAIISTAIAFTGGGAAAFFGTLGSAILTGLKTAAVAGLTSAMISGSISAISGISQGKAFGNIMQDLGNSLLDGFSDGFLSGSIFAGASMLGSSVGFRISGACNNGYGWKYGKISGGYQTPSTKGVTLFARNGGINGGRTFSLDLDLLNGLHFHTNKLKFIGLSIKSHISLPFATFVGLITSIIKNK